MSDIIAISDKNLPRFTTEQETLFSKRKTYLYY